MSGEWWDVLKMVERMLGENEIGWIVMSSEILFYLLVYELLRVFARYMGMKNLILNRVI